MSSDNDLCELVGRLKHADYELRKAVEVAIRLKGLDPTGSELGWPEMDELVDRIEAVRVALAKLPVVGILEAIPQMADQEALRQSMLDTAKAQREKDEAGKKPKEWST